MQLQATNVHECMQDFNKAISLDPDNSDIYHHRGQVGLLFSASRFNMCKW